MKRYSLLIAYMLMALFVAAQTPKTFNYQGVARNAAGQPYANSTISLRLSLRSGAPNGAAAYVETRNVTTNAYGLFNVVINSPGAVVQTGDFEAINWAQGTKYLQTEIDPAGGSNFTSIGNTPLQSVPFSLMAAKAADLVFPRADYFTNSSSSVWYLDNSGTTAPLHLKNSGTGTALIAAGTSGTAITATTTSANSTRGAVDGFNTGTAGFGIRGTATSVNAVGVEAVNGSGLALNVNGRVKIAGGNTSPGAGKVLTSDATGNATWQPAVAPAINKVGFSVSGSPLGGLEALPNNAWYKYHGGTEEYDPGNDYTLYNQGTPSLPSSSFTAPVAGFYSFNAMVRIAAPGASNFIKQAGIRILVKRGAAISTWAQESIFPYYNDVSMSSSSLSLSRSMPLQIGDQVWVELNAETTEGTNPVLESVTGPTARAYHYFSGHLIFAN